MPSDSTDPARALAQPMEPPAELRGRVLRTLLERGLIAPSRRRPPVTRILVYAAVAALLIAGGAWLGRTWPTVLDSRPRFVLFLYEDEQFKPRVGHDQLVAEYTAWADSLRDERKLLMAEELAPQETTLPLATAGVSTSFGKLAGFFIVRAASIEEATAIARQCPHLKHGGRVVLRRFAE